MGINFQVTAHHWGKSGQNEGRSLDMGIMEKGCLLALSKSLQAEAHLLGMVFPTTGWAS